MKVLLINGSPHTSGNTYLALKEAAQDLEKNSIEAEIVGVGTKPVRGCIVGITEKSTQTTDDFLCREEATRTPDLFYVANFSSEWGLLGFATRSAIRGTPSRPELLRSGHGGQG